MVEHQDYLGFYYFMGMVLDVKEVDGQLVAAVPGVPAGYEIVLEPTEGDNFRLRGGPLDGMVSTFVHDESGEVVSIQTAGFELVKIEPEKANDLPTTERLLAPELYLTPDKEAQFAALLQNILERADGDWIDYNLPYPKHEFIQYVIAQDIVIFHGSNNSEIELFSPTRKSIELRDETGRGNMQAVYGTHDGLWSMFFAIVDRPHLRGSIRNGVMYFHNKAGNQLAVYNFSINQDQLPEKPWRDGTLYFLPRETFVRLKLTDQVYANEWASEQAVRPLAKLHLQPEDFPFLDQIGGHDDGELMRLGELADAIRKAALHAQMDQDGLSVTLSIEMAEQLKEYIELQGVFMPAAKFSVTPSDGSLVLEVSSLPPAFRQVLRDDYADLLKD